MNDKQLDALQLADALEQSLQQTDADDYVILVDRWLVEELAVELRRLHEENGRLAGEVANRNRRALDGDEAVAALSNVHAYYEKLERINAQLLEALKRAEFAMSFNNWNWRSDASDDLKREAHQAVCAAIAKAEGNHAR
jgi:hypothetical protein